MRPYLFFLFVFICSGVGIGAFWIYRELTKPVEAAAQVASSQPFQKPEETLADVPETEAAHLRELMVVEEPLAPAVASTAPVPQPESSAPAAQPTPVSAPVEVVYDATEELANTQRLINSYAPLRDPSVSLDTPANQQAIEEMRRNAAQRAMQMPTSMPRPQR